MLKNLLKTKGTNEMSANELRDVKGGGDNCFSDVNGGGCRCDFPTYCVIVPASGSCPSGSVPANPRCFR